jgi:hypothetical protein
VVFIKKTFDHYLCGGPGPVAGKRSLSHYPAAVEYRLQSSSALKIETNAEANLSRAQRACGYEERVEE